MQANKPVDTSQQFDLLRLQTQAFEAINELVRSASNDTLPLVGHLIPVVLQRLALTMSSANAHGTENPGDLQVDLCQDFCYVGPPRGSLSIGNLCSYKCILSYTGIIVTNKLFAVC